MGHKTKFRTSGLKQAQGGFTLVELAIVLMIIGLLIAGILRGQELMQNAKVVSTVKQVLSYSSVMTTFRDAYGAMPGDIANGINRLPGCSPGNNCVNGNGDGIMGTLVPGQNAMENQPWYSIDPGINSENTQFWKHLALTHLISGVTPSASTPEWGKSHPTTFIGSGFFVRQTNFVQAGFPAWTGTILVMRNPISGEWLCGGGGATDVVCAISPLRAAQIDRKLDDGMASSGDARAVSANWSNGCGNPNQGTNGPSGYDERKEAVSCDMMFKIN